MQPDYGNGKSIKLLFYHEKTICDRSFGLFFGRRSRSQSTQANALLRTLEGRRSAARMLLDDSGESAGILSRLLPRMPRDAYWFQLALDTRI